MPLFLLKWSCLNQSLRHSASPCLSKWFPLSSCNELSLSVAAACHPPVLTYLHIASYALCIIESRHRVLPWSAASARISFWTGEWRPSGLLPATLHADIWIMKSIGTISVATSACRTRWLAMTGIPKNNTKIYLYTMTVSRLAKIQ